MIQVLTYNLNEKNKYWSLYSAIRDDILSGKIKCGDKLPSKRALAENLSVSVITVQNAYDQLLAEGYINSVERSGYFVAEVNADFHGRREVPPAEEKSARYSLDLVHGTATELFPFSTWTRLMRKVLADCGEHLLERVPCSGDGELKRAVAAYLYRARGIDVDPRFVVIGAGAEYLYGVIVQLLGRDKIFAVENPGYGKISATYKLNGAECVYLPVGERGIEPADVEKSNADAVHISPSHQFPTGAVMPASERSRLIGWAKSKGGFIIEDDYDSEFRLSGKPLQCAYSLCPDRVIYMNTFSKSLAPSMRMGYMILPPALYARYLEIFSRSACVVPLFEQKTLAAMLDGGYFERHVSRMKNHYRGVRAAVMEKLNSLGTECVIHDTGSGLHLLAQFPKAPSEEYIKKSAEERGVYLKCLTDYLLSPAEVLKNCAVINYSGVKLKN